MLVDVGTVTKTNKFSQNERPLSVQIRSTYLVLLYIFGSLEKPGEKRWIGGAPRLACGGSGAARLRSGLPYDQQRLQRSPNTNMFCTSPHFYKPFLSYNGNVKQTCGFQLNDPCFSCAFIALQHHGGNSKRLLASTFLYVCLQVYRPFCLCPASSTKSIFSCEDMITS